MTTPRSVRSLALVCFLLAPLAAQADVYLHNPRGSNNTITTTTEAGAFDALLAWLGSFF